MDYLELKALNDGVLNDHKFPDNLDDPVTRACVIQKWPEFARACNARLIISNEPPKPEQMPVSDASTHPYCIWYPDFATEHTYRQLAQEFPWIRYQVGRACAAAGYASLYTELKLLPDVCIAEEARESRTDGGRVIYEAIMEAPMRYAVMDDLELPTELHHPRSPAFLNGDTDVRWKLGHRSHLDTVRHVASTDHLFHEEPLASPCIEEDMQSRLLYQPLPQDLPTVKKRTLTEMAAYEGNVDRYARLAWPEPLSKTHVICVMRGIYHHTVFARWWSEKIATNSPRARALSPPMLSSIQTAISARRIMVNDVQEFHNGWTSSGPQPFLIWWPLKPERETIYTLIENVPEMSEQTAIACIRCGYYEIIYGMKPKPTCALWQAAKQSLNPFYTEWLEKWIVELQMEEKYIEDEDYWDVESALIENKEPTSTVIRSPLDEGLSRESRDQDYSPVGPYNSESVKAGYVESFVWVKEETLRKIEEFFDGHTRDVVSVEEMTEEELETWKNEHPPFTPYPS